MSWQKHDFIKKYLLYTRDTEPPIIMQTWAALACVSACMGRHINFPFSLGDVYGNLYVLLVGPAGTRKSTSLKIATSLLSEAKIRKAPDDTSGQRQGLIEAILQEDEVEVKNSTDKLAKNVSELFDQLEDISIEPTFAFPEDKHTLFIAASEFGSFMGQGNLDLTRFLGKLWDGESYTYKLKTEERCITKPDPLLSMLACTTPADMAQILPPEAFGQGFMSRIVLVHAATKERKIPPKFTKLDTELEQDLKDTFRHISTELHGAMSITDSAENLYNEIYMNDVTIPDVRFTHYSERRMSHLLKLCMVLAIARDSMTIETIDVEAAESLLSITERDMPAGLGEFGLSPLGAARQKMLEFIIHAKQPVAYTILWAMMQKDMKLLDFRASLREMQDSGKIIQVKTKYGEAFVAPEVRVHELVLTELAE